MFEPSEIFQFAIRIEENGEKFYRRMAKELNDKKIKELFNFLAAEELKHKEIYTKMVAEIETYEPFESYPGEYFDYLRAYADSLIFDQKKLADEINQIKDSLSAIEFAMDRELDSILYYNEAKNLVSKKPRQSIDGIIAEERTHFLKLSELKKLLTP